LLFVWGHAASHELGLAVGPVTVAHLTDFGDNIDLALATLGNQWVLVFDQINKLFVKPMNRQAKDASGLDVPLHMSSQVRKPGQITSVISASANSEMACKKRHEGFDEYIHRTDMSHDELFATFGATTDIVDAIVDESSVEPIVALTGAVPLYVSRFLVEFHNDRQEYSDDLECSVKGSLFLLKRDLGKKFASRSFQVFWKVQLLQLLMIKGAMESRINAVSIFCLSFHWCWGRAEVIYGMK
jgi:hypothetical protein